MIDMDDPAEVTRFLDYCSEEIGTEGMITRADIGTLIRLAGRGSARADAMERVLREVSQDQERVHITVRAEIDQALDHINDGGTQG